MRRFKELGFAGSVARDARGAAVTTFQPDPVLWQVVARCVGVVTARELSVVTKSRASHLRLAAGSAYTKRGQLKSRRLFASLRVMGVGRAPALRQAAQVASWPPQCRRRFGALQSVACLIKSRCQRCLI